MTQPNQGYDNTGGYGQSANPYGQPNIAGQPSYGQPSPYGQTSPYGQPDPYQGGGYPQSGQQGDDGQPGWGMQQTPAKPPALRALGGWIFGALAGRYPHEQLAARLRDWSEEGRCIGELIAWDGSWPIIRYRLAEPADTYPPDGLVSSISMASARD